MCGVGVGVAGGCAGVCVQYELSYVGEKHDLCHFYAGCQYFWRAHAHTEILFHSLHCNKCAPFGDFIASCSICNHAYKHLLIVTAISEHVRIIIMNSEHSERCKKVPLSHSREGSTRGRQCYRDPRSVRYILTFSSKLRPRVPLV